MTFKQNDAGMLLLEITNVVVVVVAAVIVVVVAVDVVLHGCLPCTRFLSPILGFICASSVLNQLRTMRREER